MRAIAGRLRIDRGLPCNRFAASCPEVLALVDASALMDEMMSEHNSRS